MPTLAEQLVELQRIDSLIDQHEHQRERSPLRQALASAIEQRSGWERRRGELTGRIEALNAEIERDEVRGGAIATHLERLERQLKTVIAPREAEALMHEIATLTAERDELDIAELEAMEEQSALETLLAEHLDGDVRTRDAVEAATSELDGALSEIDVELAGLRESRPDAASVLPPALLSQYEGTRSHLGVAVARLEGKRCVPCNLDRSAAELDAIRAGAAEAGYADCLECGRMIVP